MWWDVLQPRYRAIIGGVLIMAVASSVRGEEAMERKSGADRGSKPREAMALLICDDARKNEAARKIDAPENLDADKSVVVLEPLVVTDEKALPGFTAPRENRVEKLLRTGTIREYVGRKTTVRLWTSGDAGLVLSFRW